MVETANGSEVVISLHLTAQNDSQKSQKFHKRLVSKPDQ